MKICSKIALKSLAVAAAISLIVGCTDVDNSLGMGLLPDNQVMKMGVVNLTGVNTLMAKNDSIPTKHLGRLLLGNYKIDDLGFVSCAGAMEFVPSNFNKKYYYGYKPVVDSVTLSLFIGNVYGDTKIEQKFYIYELNESLDADTSAHYYANFDARAISNMAKPLFSFTLKGERKMQKAFKLKTEAGGRDFIQRLIELDTEMYDKADTVFKKLFKGLYIAPSEDPAEAPKDAAIYNMAPLAAFPYDHAFFTIHGYSLNKEDEKNPLERKDTLTVSYSLNDDDVYRLHPSVSVGLIEHDYTGSTIDPSTLLPRVTKENLDSVKLLTPINKVYAEGMLGVATYLNFTDQFMAELKSKAFVDGKQYILMVNRAMMYIWMDDDRIELMNEAPTRLGMFHDLKGQYPKAIMDYMYVEEQMYDYQSAYKGYLNRGHGYYEMDISMYIRMLASSAEYEGVNQWIYLAPGSFFDPKGVALINDPAAGQDREIEVEVWYTLMKNRFE